jgi:membrane-bound serine protease (ClpP class)
MRPLKLSKLFFLLLFSLISLAAQEDRIPSFDPETKYLVYYFEIRDEIAPPSWRKTQMAIDEAIQMKADVIVLRLNTYGGLVDAADSIRSKILNSPIPVMVLIENNAASAGALIALACDSIFMLPGSTIGAATVVNQSGEAVPDKYQSYMRKKMRATAEENGRDPDIAEAMVDPDKVVEGISEKGKVLTLTSTEAVHYGICDKQVKNLSEALEYSGLSLFEMEKQRMTTLDKIIAFLINPAVSGLLIILIIGGIYFELQSPGIGFPILAVAVAATLYFAPLYLEGLAENWEIIIFIAGVVLIALEIFVIPGFGIAGISGMILLFGGLILSMVNNIGFDFEPIDGEALGTSILVVLVSAIMGLTGSILLAMRLLKTNMFARIAVQAVQSKEEGYIGTSQKEVELVGRTGESLTVLRPSGKVVIDGEVYDATARVGFIDKGVPIVVEKYETAQLFVLPSE